MQCCPGWSIGRLILAQPAHRLTLGAAEREMVLRSPPRCGFGSLTGRRSAEARQRCRKKSGETEEIEVRLNRVPAGVEAIETDRTPADHLHTLHLLL